MKKRMKKFWLIAMCVAALTIVSAIPASADVSRVVYFSVQSNTACNATDRFSGFEISISNISSNSTTATLYLYDSSGNPLTQSGATNNGYISSVTPGTQFLLGGKESAYYNASYGYTGGYACTLRPAWGRIVVDSDSGQLVASGEMRALYTATSNMANSTPVLVNNGQPF